MATDRVSKGISIPRDLFDELEEARPDVAHRSIYYVYWLALGYELDRAVRETADSVPFDPVEPTAHTTRAVIRQMVADWQAAEDARDRDALRERIDEERHG